MRKKLLAVILCASMLFPASVSAEVLGYEATLDTYTKEKKTPQQFQIDDGAGNTVNVLAKSDTLYVTAKNTEIRSNPGDSGTELRSVILGTKLERVAVCDNGWSKVTFQKKGEDKIIGYVSDSVLSDTEIVINLQIQLQRHRTVISLIIPASRTERLYERSFRMMS